MVRSLRSVPPTTALPQRRTTKRLYFGPSPALALLDKEKSKAVGKKKKEPNIPGLNAEALRPGAVKFQGTPSTSD